MHSADIPNLADNGKECINFKTASQVDAISYCEQRVVPEVVEATSGRPSGQL